MSKSLNQEYIRNIRIPFSNKENKLKIVFYSANHHIAKHLISIPCCCCC